MNITDYKKRLFLIFVVIVLIIPSVAIETLAVEEIQVSAEAAILIEAETGRVLFEKNSNDQLRIASITKIMTAIVAIENGDLDKMVMTSKNAYGVEGSSIYLRPGEKLSLENMIYGLMLRSGNDAAVAIAEHIGGSVEGFVFLMNQKAAELGMTKTVFSNPHGLDDHEEHYSSARDMAVLTAYAMRNKAFETIVGTKRKTAPLEGEKWDRIWHNKNRILSKYPYADGVKTGYTKRAKRTLVSSATKDGYRLITVTLNAPDDWNDHINMFEYGFNHYTKVTLSEKGEKLKDERMLREDGYFITLLSSYYPLAKDEHVQKKVVLDKVFNKEWVTEAPFPAGYIQFTLNGEEISRSPLEFVSDFDERSSFWKTLRNLIGKWLGGM